METNMTNEKQPRLDAIAIITFGEEKTKWTKIGAAFPLKKRSGYSVRLEFLPVPKEKCYEFILVEPEEKKEDDEE